jgi:hypothetical protein
MSQCASRANSSLGSSKGYPTTSTELLQSVGYLGNDPALNPMFASWTKVYLPYGDGTSQLGDVTEPVIVTEGAPPIYFRGARVLRAMINYLRDEGLAAATEVVVSGCSAGGLATYAHADTWSAALPKARVTALSDSGFFLNYTATGMPFNLTFPGRMLWTYMNTNVSGGGLLSPACTSMQQPGLEWLCMFAENLSRTLKTPLFALQSKYDSYQIGSILHANASDISAINAYGALLRSRVFNSLLSNPKHGAALDSCYHHCGGAVWAEIPFSSSIVGQGAAFASWYAGSKGVFEQQDVYPCKKCCGGVP